MNNLISKITTLSLALLVLFSTFSFTVEKHYCGDFLVDVSFLGDADNCGMVSLSDCNRDLVKVKKKCCKDEVHIIEGFDELQKTGIDKVSFEIEKSTIAFSESYSVVFVLNKKELPSFNKYLPPNLIVDIQLLNEVFLI